MIKRILLVLGFVWGAATLTGCATATLDSNVSADLQNSNVAVAATMETKRIRYSEMVYKVLWNETREQEAMFDGFWDIDADLAKHFSGELNKFGITAKPAYQLLSPEMHTSLKKAIITPYDAKGVAEPVVIDGEIVKSLTDQGFKYLVLWRSNDFYLFTTTMNSSAPVYMSTTMIVYDLTKKQQVFYDPYLIAGGVKFDESPREIEDDNLAQLRQNLGVWIETSSKARLPKALGMAE